MLEFRLGRPARILVTVYGPGPSCDRLGTFSRRGHAGQNRVRFTGTLFGRALAPGRYAIVVEAVRGSNRVRVGRVLVVILARDGREGGSRPLLAPDCGGASRSGLAILTAGGDFGSVSALDDSSRGDIGAGAGGSGKGAGGVAGVSAGQGDGEGDELPILPNLPALPALPAVPIDDPFSVPPWAFVALAILGALGAAALIGAGVRRYREGAGGGWD